MLDSILTVVRIIFAILMLFFLPGFTLINALFPRKGELDEEYDILYRIGLGIGMSIAISILVGYILGGLLAAFYAENIAIFLITLTIIFFVIGIFRGSYPSIYAVEREETPEELMDKLEKLIKKAEEYRKIIKVSPKEMKKEYREKLQKVLREIREIENKLDRMVEKE